MYKTVSFNIYDLKLENIVYKEQKTENSSRFDRDETSKARSSDQFPIPKPMDDVWTKPVEPKKR